MPKQRSCLLCCTGSGAKGAGAKEETAQEPAEQAGGHGGGLCCPGGTNAGHRVVGPSGQSFENMHCSLSFFTSDWLSIASLYCSLLVGLHSF